MITAGDIEQIKRHQQERNAKSKTFDKSSQRTDNNTKASLTEVFDTELYEANNGDRFEGYSTTVVEDDDEDMPDVGGRKLIGQYTADKRDDERVCTRRRRSSSRKNRRK